MFYCLQAVNAVSQLPSFFIDELYLVWGLMLHNLQPVYYHVSLFSTVAFQVGEFGLQLA